MLNNKGFDQWSGAYDEDILRMQNEGYPFEGYYHTLGMIQNKVLDCNAKLVLDIGIGTGLLSEVLYNKGVQITGVDFSAKMLDQAKQNPWVLDVPEPTVIFELFGADSLQFRLYAWVDSGAVFLKTRDALHREIDRAFREQGVEIAFPQRDVHLASGTPVPVQIVSGTPDTQ